MVIQLPSKFTKLIGHGPMLIPHAVVILFNEENKVLFEVRADDGYLDFPGGSVDMGEEVKELLFLDVNDINGKLSPRNKKVIEDIKARLL